MEFLLPKFNLLAPKLWQQNFISNLHGHRDDFAIDVIDPRAGLNNNPIIKSIGFF
jgi:hypothetical protein